MLVVTQKNLVFALPALLLAMWSAPAHASVDVYKCTFEPKTVFGERIDFSYDLERNTVLVQEYQNSAGYSPAFTLGNVDQEGGMLQFAFEYWESGTIAMRDSLSLDFETMGLNASQDSYTEDGSLAGHGETATGICVQQSGAANSQTIAAAKSVTSPADAPSSVSGEQPSPSGKPICHTEENSAEGPKSTTWCVTSVLPSQKETSYGPKNLARGDDGAWCEGDEGHGIGVSVEVTFLPWGEGSTPPSFDRLMIANGYDKTTKTFMENSRVKKIEIKSDDDFGGQSWVRSLRDETGVQEVMLGGPQSPKSIIITILDVYPGQKYEDTCLGSIGGGFGF